MADNLQVTEGTGSKFIRYLEKVAGIFTHLTAIDIGAGTTETRLVAGQAAKAASIPVTMASDQDPAKVAGVDATGAALTGVPVAVAAEVRTSRRSGETNGDYPLMFAVLIALAVLFVGVTIVALVGLWVLILVACWRAIDDETKS